MAAVSRLGDNLRMAKTDLRAAVLLGAATGMRTFSGLATLSASGRLALEPPRLRTALNVAAAGELIGDKLPFTPARTEELPYLGRVVGGFLCGGIVAGPAGALVAAASSALVTELAYRKRRFLTTRLHVPDLPLAVLEDAIAYGAAHRALAARAA